MTIADWWLDIEGNMTIAEQLFTRQLTADIWQNCSSHAEAREALGISQDTLKHRIKALRRSGYRLKHFSNGGRPKKNGEMYAL